MNGTFKITTFISIILMLFACGGSNSDPDVPDPVNTIPLADAGVNQSVATNELVTLNGGSSSDADSDPLTYAWTISSQPSGSDASLSNATLISPTFTANVAGIYVIELIVNDGSDNSIVDSVEIVAIPPNTAPVANAGIDQNIELGTVVSLNGTASSDPEGDNISYNWSFLSIPNNSNAMLSSNISPTPSFTPDIEGTYDVQLIVSDGMLNSTASTLAVIVSVSNSAPIANAGIDQNVTTGSVVMLDGMASSDSNNDLITYVWRLSSAPSASNADIQNNTSVSSNFTADVDGSYIIELVVNDGTVNSTPDTVEIIATTANSAPIANAGSDDNVVTGQSETLNGSSSSDADGDTLTYQWSLITAPTGSTASIVDSTSSVSSFTPDIDGVYVLQLVVNDGMVDSAPDTVMITANAFNNRPEAQAGPEQFVTIGALVTLDGSGSSDPDGDMLNYMWTISSVPSNSGATLSNANTVSPTFIADLEGVYVINLIVNDGQRDSFVRQVRVNAIIPRIELYSVVGTQEALLTLPYDADVTATANFENGVIYRRITTYKLVALAQTITIGSVSATDSTGTYTPRFSGLQAGQVLQASEPVTFELQSTATNGVFVDFEYAFNIVETGDTFLVRVSFKGVTIIP